MTAFTDRGNVYNLFAKTVAVWFWKCSSKTPLVPILLQVFQIHIFPKVLHSVLSSCLKIKFQSVRCIYLLLCASPKQKTWSLAYTVLQLRQMPISITRLKYPQCQVFLWGYKLLEGYWRARVTPTMRFGEAYAGF